MLQLLHARECGLEVAHLDDVLHERWIRLQCDTTRRLRVPFALSALHAIDLDLPSGTLILCGGIPDTEPHPPAPLGILRRPQPGELPDSHPLVSAAAEHVAAASVTCTKWFPYDPAIFLSGSANYPTVSLWDTEAFAPVATIPISSHNSHPRRQHQQLQQHVVNVSTGVSSLAFSTHSSARSDLAAATAAGDPYVTLIDLEASSAVHVLYPDDAREPIQDIAWSPTHPHHLAAVDYSGNLSLFDIRRSGAVACLLQMNQYSRPFPLPFSTTTPSSLPLPNTAMTPWIVAKERMASPKPFELLRLGCAWRSPSDVRRGSLHTRRRRSAHAERRQVPSARNSHVESPFRRYASVRYTADGSTLVSRRLNESFVVHDVLTGCVLNVLRAGVASSNRLEHTVTFDITPDGEHIISPCVDYLFLIDRKTNGFVHAVAHDLPAINNSILHPLDEEVYTVHNGYINCWSGVPPPKGKTRTALVT